MKTKDIGELNSLFLKAEEVDRAVFAEMRSNILLVSGEHYAKPGRGEEPRTSGERSSEQARLRLTKNHCHRLSQVYTNALLSEDPGVAILPQIETDLQDRKEAELNKSVWRYISQKNKFSERKADWAKNLVDIGEVCVKIFWDYTAGDFTGEYEATLDPAGEEILEETGEMEEIIDPMTQIPTIVPKMMPVPDKSKPIFSGAFIWEEVLPFNLLRDPSAKDMDDPTKPWIVRKMVDTKTLKHRYAKDEHITKALNASQDETYVVFDASRSDYGRAEDETMIREYYWRSSYDYPNGYYVYATKDVILEEGELPKGRWPFAWASFNKFQSTPRGRSILKVARPYQIEINRASSMVAETQITLGSDKVLHQAGAKLTQGSTLPGIRSIQYQGNPPTILPGRDGSQYAPYVAGQIEEFEQVTMMLDMMQKSESAQMDPYILMYQSASKKRAHKIYNDKFGAFLVDICEITLDLAKEFLPDDTLIPAIGARELVNIEEFRNTDKLSHKITIEPGIETLESQFGKQLTFQHVLQYVGKNLDPSTIGKMIRDLPFGNSKDAFEDLTLDDDIAENTMLALERGQQITVNPYIDPAFMLKKLTKRTSTPEHQFFAPEIKEAYAALINEYENIRVEQEQKIQAAKNEYIPVDGALVPVDMYVTDPKDPSKSKRARLPYAALEWLMRTLEAQGQSQESLESMNAQTLSQMAEKLMASQGQGGGQVLPMPQMMG